jgi:hypothetical protein
VGLGVAIVVPAGAAAARGDGWEPLVYPDQVEGCCGSTVVHVTFPHVKEFQRSVPQPDGTVTPEITGTDRTRRTTDVAASLP